MASAKSQLTNVFLPKDNGGNNYHTSKLIRTAKKDWSPCHTYSALLKTIKRELLLDGRNSSLFQFKVSETVPSSHRP